MDDRDFAWSGPRISDRKILRSLPTEYAEFLDEVNGCIQFDGGLHIRGICDAPSWHSLQYVWRGPLALHKRYATVERGDIPFAQTASGDQFLLRDSCVHRLPAGYDDLKPMSPTFREFLASAREDPLEFLGLYALRQLRSDGGVLEPGQAVGIYPPYVFEESAAGTSVWAMSSLELVKVYADLARQTASLPVGTRVKVALPTPRQHWWSRKARPKSS